MAALTSDRIGRVEKRFPVPVDSPFLLGDGVVIFAGSMFALCDDGKAYNLNVIPGGRTIRNVLYAPSHLERGVASPHMHQGGGSVPAGEGVSGIDVYMNAVGLTTANEGAPAFATDDNTVTATGPGIAPVGRIQIVMSATYALVRIDGKERDLAL